MDGVVFRDRAQFDAKRTKLREDGVGRMHIVADFDRTLTKSTRPDGSINTSMGTLWHFMPEAFVKKAKELYAHYRPIETDPHVSRSEKLAQMIEWQRKWEAITVEYGLSREMIRDMVSSGLLCPREGLAQFMSLVGSEDIPLVILSAGLGDMIEEYLRFYRAYPLTVHIISNFGAYDSGGKCIGWSDQVITSMNKNESQLLKEERNAVSKERPNVLLLGDHAADIHMADGETHDTILSIGFLNGETANLEDHKSLFDAVILEDGSLDFPIETLRAITAQP